MWCFHTGCEDIYLYPIQKYVLQAWRIKEILETEALFEERWQSSDMPPELMGRGSVPGERTAQGWATRALFRASTVARSLTVKPRAAFHHLCYSHICRMEIITYA